MSWPLIWQHYMSHQVEVPDKALGSGITASQNWLRLSTNEKRNRAGFTIDSRACIREAANSLQMDLHLEVPKISWPADPNHSTLAAGNLG